MSATLSAKAILGDVLVLEPDPSRNSKLGRTISRILPNAHVYCARSAAEAARVLAARRVKLFIVALHGFDFDILTLLGVWAEHRNRATRVLILARNSTPDVLAAVKSLPIAGVFEESRSGMAELEMACRSLLRPVRDFGSPFNAAQASAIAMGNLQRLGRSLPPAHTRAFRRKRAN